jgi:hypothetical protein
LAESRSYLKEDSGALPRRRHIIFGYGKYHESTGPSGLYF